MTDIMDRIYEVATNGYPVEELVVISNEDDHPLVMAFIPDAETDIVPVLFDQDGFVEIKCESFEYLHFYTRELNLIDDLLFDSIQLFEGLNEFYDSKNYCFDPAWKKKFETIPKSVEPFSA